MKRVSFAKICFSSAAAGMLVLVAGIASASQPSGPGNRAVPQFDVALAVGGVLQGTVVDRQGTPLPDRNVVLVQEKMIVAKAVTDASGRFTINNVHGGTYVLASENGAGLYRLWSEGTAPPAAARLAHVHAGDVQRGQVAGGGPGFFGGLHWPALRPKAWFHHPWVLGAGIGGAVALPLALHDDESGS